MRKILLIVVGIIFIGCGGSGGDGGSTPLSLSDITLIASQYQVCTDDTDFTVTPYDDPSVVFTTNTSTNDTNISLTSDSNGSILLENCTTND